MKRRYAVFAVVLAVSILIGIQAVEVVDANPFFGMKGIDPVPGTIPPTITMITPLNNTAYSSDEITISFHVTKPQLAGSWSTITYICYSLDNTEDVNDEYVKVYSNYINGEGTVGVPEFNTTFTIPSLSAGNHVLKVKVSGAVMPNTQYVGGQWQSPNINHGIFSMNSNSTTFFTISTTPTPSLSPTPTKSQSTASNYLIEQTFLFTIASVIVIVAVASISLVYFKRRRGKQ
jgi:hypothetical protein